MKCVGKTDSTGFFLFQVIQLTFRPLVSSHLKTQRCSRNGLRELLDFSVQLSSSICVCTQSGSVQHSSIQILVNVHIKRFKFSNKSLLLHLTSVFFFISKMLYEWHHPLLQAAVCMQQAWAGRYWPEPLFPSRPDPAWICLTVRLAHGLALPPPEAHKSSFRDERLSHWLN